MIEITPSQLRRIYISFVSSLKSSNKLERLACTWAMPCGTAGSDRFLKMPVDVEQLRSTGANSLPRAPSATWVASCGLLTHPRPSHTPTASRSRFPTSRSTCAEAGRYWLDTSWAPFARVTRGQQQAAAITLLNVDHCQQCSVDRFCFAGYGMMRRHLVGNNRRARAKRRVKSFHELLGSLVVVPL